MIEYIIWFLEKVKVILILRIYYYVFNFGLKKEYNDISEIISNNIIIKSDWKLTKKSLDVYS